jgi:hypothetical protein
MGLAWIIVYFKWRHLRTADGRFGNAARFFAMASRTSAVSSTTWPARFDHKAKAVELCDSEPKLAAAGQETPRPCNPRFTLPARRAKRLPAARRTRKHDGNSCSRRYLSGDPQELPTQARWSVRTSYGGRLKAILCPREPHLRIPHARPVDEQF